MAMAVFSLPAPGKLWCGQKLKQLKLVEEGLGKWHVTRKGLKEAGAV
jgi:hypothetical protein